MSETSPIELKVLVERVVRPLPVPLDRQKRLRAEFLGHLQAIHAEELAKGGDAAAALSRTAERFGDPSDLTAELRRSIPWWRRSIAWFERSLAQRPRESVAHFVIRILSWTLLMLAILIGAVLAGQFALAPHRMSIVKVKGAIGAVACLAVFLAGFLFFSLQFGMEWQQPRRRWPRIVVCMIGLIATWPASVSAMSLVALGTWAGDALPLPAAIAGGAFCTIVGTAVGVLHRRDTVYRNEWAGLDLQAM